MDDFQVFVLLKHTYGITDHQASEHGREGGPGLSRGRSLELQHASQVRVCHSVELEGTFFFFSKSILHLQIATIGCACC